MKKRFQGLLERHEFLRNVLVLLGGTVGAQIIALALQPVLTRLYTPADYGIFTLYTSILTCILTIVALRYDVALVLPKDLADAKTLARASSWICAGVSVVVTVIAVVWAQQISALLHAPGLRFWLYSLGAALFIAGQTQIYGMWLTRQKKFRPLAVNQVGQLFTTGGSQIALAFVGAGGVTGLVIGCILGYLRGFIHFWVVTREDFRGLRVARSRAVELLAEHKNMPLLNGPNAVLDAVRTTGKNTLIAAKFSSAGALGQYSLAFRVTQAPLALINGAMAQVYFQRLAVAEPGEMSPLIRTCIKWSAIVGLPIFTLVYFAAPPLFPIIFGHGWEQAGYISAALCPWLFMNTITTPLANAFVVMGKQLQLLLFAIAYTACPLIIISVWHTDLVQTVALFSWGMAALLGVFLVMVTRLARTFDAQPPTAAQ